MNELKRIACCAILSAIVVGGDKTIATQGVKLLTPSVDTCRAYTAAISGNDRVALAGFSGWLLGFLSGMAQGTGSDFLRDVDVAELNKRLYESCRAQSDKSLSSVVEEMAKSLMASHQNQQ